ncbi:MAG: hypothetical protein VX603_10130 [Gemmatimonadota bacterium]|nr:hypothetical protein [Gemmatimonadota bacterium]
MKDVKVRSGTGVDDAMRIHIVYFEIGQMYTVMLIYSSIYLNHLHSFKKVRFQDDVKVKTFERFSLLTGLTDGIQENIDIEKGTR